MEEGQAHPSEGRVSRCSKLARRDGDDDGPLKHADVSISVGCRAWQSRSVSEPELDRLAARLQADLRLRFPDIEVTFELDADGTWEAVVTDGGFGWGRVSTWLVLGDEVSPDETEKILAAVGRDVADNLWPDELTERWPVGPQGLTCGNALALPVLLEVNAGILRPAAMTRKAHWRGISLLVAPRRFSTILKLLRTN
jgi:hypothetical protein